MVGEVNVFSDELGLWLLMVIVVMCMKVVVDEVLLIEVGWVIVIVNVSGIVLLMK